MGAKFKFYYNCRILTWLGGSQVQSIGFFLKAVHQIQQRISNFHKFVLNISMNPILTNALNFFYKTLLSSDWLNNSWKFGICCRIRWRVYSWFLKHLISQFGFSNSWHRKFVKWIRYCESEWFFFTEVYFAFLKRTWFIKICWNQLSK